MDKIQRFTLQLLFAFIAALLVVPNASAQTATADILGKVVDPQVLRFQTREL